jgi:hypothetical protein
VARSAGGWGGEYLEEVLHGGLRDADASVAHLDAQATGVVAGVAERESDGAHGRGELDRIAESRWWLKGEWLVDLATQVE